MGQMFYNSDEARAKLGCSEDDFKKLIQDGKLREFRDGAKLMFKVDEVDALAETTNDASASHGPIDLSSSGTADQLGLSGTGSSLALTPLDTGSAMGLGMSSSDSSDYISLDDTTSAVDDDKDGTVVTDHGVSVFDESDDDMAAVDPLAQTKMAPEDGDQIELESSGSGLLDLSREADDTSLGAELLEEIYPGADDGAQQPVSQLEQIAAGAQSTTDEAVNTSAAASQIAAPVTEMPARMVQAYDYTSGAYGVMLIVPFLILVLLGCIAISGVMDIRPTLLSMLQPYNWYVIGGAAVLSIAIAIVGSVMANSTPKPASEKKAKAKKAPKTPKSKKAKKVKKAKNKK